MAHQRGVVASVHYKSVGDHPYSGFFAEGADFGVLRLSETGFLIDGVNMSNPSLAIKFFVDGNQSANVVTMIDWANQDTLNFFPRNEEGEFKPFTTHPPAPTDRCMRDTVGRTLRDATTTPFTSGCSTMGLLSNHGGSTKLEEGEFTTEDRLFPFELQFVPNGNAIPVYTEGQNPLDYLASIQKVEGEPLFFTFGRQNPGDDLEKIGEVWLDEDMYTSQFGDTKLFFQHDTLARDTNRARTLGLDSPLRKKWA